MKKFLSILSTSLIAFAGTVTFDSCKKNEPENPYEGILPIVQNENPEPDNFPTGSFAWLHAKVFKPTCANSGCHDGTFEPEFRSISSAYNSLVNHPVIANDAAMSFDYRVVPGNANASFIHERLTVEIPNTSGMMPLVVEPGSDWTPNSAMYIEKITDWINNGAEDMFGNAAPAAGANYPPLVGGLAVFPVGNTTTPFPREENSTYGIGAVIVPSGQVDVWILPYDDNALVTGFEEVYVKTSTNTTEFGNAMQDNCVLQSPITALDFGDTPNQFYYKATVDLTGAQSGSSYYIRCYVDDGVQPNITEIPNSGSNFFWLLLFSLKVQ